MRQMENICFSFVFNYGIIKKKNIMVKTTIKTDIKEMFSDGIF